MTQPVSGSSKLCQVLEELNQEGGYSIAVLTDSQGLTIASATMPGLDPERQSAVAALVHKAVDQAASRLGMDMEEICLNASGGQRLVCRAFDAGSSQLILAVLMNNRQQTHRRLTGRAIHSIASIWETYWG